MKYIFIVLAIFVIINVLLKTERVYYHYTKNKRSQISQYERMNILQDYLTIVSNIAKENELHPIIYYGTLLGFIRNKSIICYDFDVDFVVLEKEYYTLYNKLKDYLKNHPRYIVKELFNGVFKKKIQILDKITGLNCDIDMIRVKEEHFSNSFIDYHTTHILKECNTKHHINNLFPLNTGYLNGIHVYYPQNSDYILRCFYGNDYIEPNMICDINCDNCKEVK